MTTAVETARDAAIAAVLRGWPVIPSTYPAGNEWFGHDKANAIGLRPVDRDWHERNAVIDWETAHHVWSTAPYGVLLICGHGVDAVELPTWCGCTVWPALQAAGLDGPTVLLYPDRWALLVATSAEPSSDLSAWPAVTYRRQGHWVPLPPTALGTGPAIWHRHPGTDPVTPLPDSVAVRRAVAEALGQASA